MSSRKRIYQKLKRDKPAAAHLFTAWKYNARPDQLAPDGKWNTWVFLGGRGAGKTRAGAEWVAEGVRTGRATRVALIAATHADARSIMIEGVSGLLSVSESAEYEPSLRRITWPGSGTVATVLSADEPDSLRGHQFDAAWGDEFCKWPDAQAALDMLRMGLRLGEDPKLVITTTPRPMKALRDLCAAEGVAMTTAATKRNAVNLPVTYLRAMKSLYGGTRLGRQELEAEIIEDNESAAWRREWIDAARVREAPRCERVVVAVDPPASKTGACGIVVAGVIGDQAYVLADCSKERLTPNQWANRAADAYETFNADCVAAEANQGGDMVRATLGHAHPNMKVKLVHATKGKTTRAEPIAALYEQGRVHHVGQLAELEDEMCQYDGSGKSPDRMDALVWALTELFPQTRKAIAVPRIRWVA